MCLAAGAISSFAMAPYNVWALFIIGFGLLYAALSFSNNGRQAFFRAWCFSFGYGVFGLYWIGNALLVDGNPYLWAWPLAVCALPAFLALYAGLAGLISYKFFVLKHWHGYLGFSVLFAIAEWVRGHLFTGFPWNLYGYTWIDLPPISQVAWLCDIYGLTFLTIFWSSIAGFCLSASDKKHKVVLGCAVLISFALTYAYGWTRLNSYAPAAHDNVFVRVVQPNVAQEDKWKREEMYNHFLTALDLSRVDPNDNDPSYKTIIVWPETALNPLFLDTEHVRNSIADMLDEYAGEAVLLTGALRHNEAEGAYFNSVISFDSNGSIGNVYNKSHLVPFGEYIPFQKWIPLKPVVQFTGFRKGDGPINQSIFDTLNYTSLVCYEIIFPHAINTERLSPDFIVNVTNDAWYGKSPGPYQHLVQARFRSIETGTPVIRAANTGISSIITPTGDFATPPTKLFDADYVLQQLPEKNIAVRKAPALIYVSYIILSVLLLLSALYFKQQDTNTD